MRYTAFHVPPQYVPITHAIALSNQNGSSRLNPKHMSTSYLKTETNTMWGRKAQRSRTTADEPPPEVHLAPSLNPTEHCTNDVLMVCGLARGRGGAARMSSSFTWARGICASAARPTSRPQPYQTLLHARPSSLPHLRSSRESCARGRVVRACCSHRQPTTTNSRGPAGLILQCVLPVHPPAPTLLPFSDVSDTLSESDGARYDGSLMTK